MGLFGRRKKKDLTLTGLPGTAVIKDEHWSDFDTGDDETSLADLGIGNRKFQFDLEVTVEGRPPYPVSGWFKVPAKLGIETHPGVKLPVYVDPDDPNNIDVNWEQFVADGGNVSERWTDKDTRPSMVHDAMPAETRTMMTNGWVSAAKSGAMTADAFEQAIADAVEGGMLTTEEADAARKQVG